MDKFVASVFIITIVAFIGSPVLSFPADHREDTVLPFSLSPGNVNLETYYLDKYPQPGVPGGPLVKKSTSQMTASPLDPAPVPETGGNSFFVHKTKDPHAMFRTRREANPHPQFGAHHRYPSGGHNSQGSMGFGLYNEDNLHLNQYPRHQGSDSFYEQEERERHRHRDHYSQSSHHIHQNHHPEHHRPHQYHGRY